MNKGFISHSHGLTGNYFSYFQLQFSPTVQNYSSVSTKWIGSTIARLTNFFSEEGLMMSSVTQRLRSGVERVHCYGVTWPKCQFLNYVIGLQK